MTFVALASLPFLFLAVRRPVLRRLALRNAARRPRETALVILGSLLGTAIITGSLVVGDTLDASLSQGAITRLGPIDELVTAPDPAGRDELAASLQVLDAESDLVDGVLALDVVTAAVSSVAGPRPVERAEPSATVVEVDFGAARRFGGDPAATGIEGETPAPGQAAVGEDLAATLGLSSGDQVTVYAYGEQVQLGVDRIRAQRGVAGFSQDFGTSSPTLLVAPGTLAALSTGAPSSSSPPAALVAVSNRGGPLEGVELTDEVTAAITGHIGGAVPGLAPAKADLLTAAEDIGAEFTELFGSIGSSACWPACCYWSTSS